MLGSNHCLRKRDENLFATTQQYGDALAQETQSANQAQYRNNGGAEEARTPDLFNATPRKRGRKEHHHPKLNLKTTFPS